MDRTFACYRQVAIAMGRSPKTQLLAVLLTVREVCRDCTCMAVPVWAPCIAMGQASAYERGCSNLPADMIDLLSVADIQAALAPSLSGRSRGCWVTQPKAPRNKEHERGLSCMSSKCLFLERIRDEKAERQGCASLFVLWENTEEQMGTANRKQQGGRVLATSDQYNTARGGKNREQQMRSQITQNFPELGVVFQTSSSPIDPPSDSDSCIHWMARI